MIIQNLGAAALKIAIAPQSVILSLSEGSYSAIYPHA